MARKILEDEARRRGILTQQATNLDNSGNKLSWREWLAKYFPHSTSAPFAKRHERLWEWFEALRPGIKPRPRVEVWGRGGAKSSTAELGCLRVGQKLTRRFVVYVSSTQGQANKHVQAIAAKFEQLGMSQAIGKYGNRLGWRVDLLRCANGFNVLALGLDAAARGVKIEDYRPDLIIGDDIDERHDTAATVQKKIDAITESILPTGSADCAVLFIQNKVHKDSIVSQLADDRADFLLEREVYEEPAIEGLEYQAQVSEDGTRRYKITGGVATWEGQSLATCEKQFNEWGRKAFLREAQHLTDEEENGLWDRQRDIEPFRIVRSRLPQLLRIGVAIDPSWATKGDVAGIIGGGIAKDGELLRGYVLADRSLRGSPKQWAQEAVNLYHELQADVLLGEGNFMGEMVQSTVSTIEDAPPVKIIHVSRGKLIRAEPVQKLAEDGRLHHVGTFPELESELCTYQPGDESPGRMDALVILFSELMLGLKGEFFFV